MNDPHDRLAEMARLNRRLAEARIEVTRLTRDLETRRKLGELICNESIVEARTEVDRLTREQTAVRKALCSDGRCGDGGLLAGLVTRGLAEAKNDGRVEAHDDVSAAMRTFRDCWSALGDEEGELPDAIRRLTRELAEARESDETRRKAYASTLDALVAKVDALTRDNKALREALAEILDTDCVRNEDEELDGRAHDLLAPTPGDKT